jgi:hypothetical protein
MLWVIAIGAFVVAIIILGGVLWRERGSDEEDEHLLADLNHSLAKERLRASANRPTSRARD